MSPTAGYIWGLPELPVKDLTFDNVQISATTRGFQIDHADSLVFKNCSSITIPSGKGNAIYQSYDLLRFSGINTTTGKSTSCTTGIDIPEVNQSIRFFPQITSNKITVESESSMNRIQVFSLTGRTVLDFKVSQVLTSEIDFSTFNTGLYILQVQTIDGKVFSGKVIRI